MAGSDSGGSDRRTRPNEHGHPQRTTGEPPLRPQSLAGDGGLSTRPGTFRRITSTANPAIKDIRALEIRKYRNQTRLFLAEGLKLVADATDAGWPPETLVLTAERPAFADGVAARARTAGADIIETSRAVMEKITRRDNPQAVVGVFRQRLASLAGAAAAAGGLWVGLDRARDPGNIGTIIRTIDAAGGRGLILIGDTADPFGLEAVRATMGSIFHVPIARTSEAAFLEWLAASGWPMIGSHLAAAEDFRNASVTEPAILLMGAEQSGLSDALAAACDRLVKIPMAGRADSLNLAVATGILLFELRRPSLTL
jgi:TrmH family RNA methyltransferase